MPCSCHCDRVPWHLILQCTCTTTRPEVHHHHVRMQCYRYLVDNTHYLLDRIKKHEQMNHHFLLPRFHVSLSLGECIVVKQSPNGRTVKYDQLVEAWKRYCLYASLRN